jgi:hypothetical protein
MRGNVTLWQIASARVYRNQTSSEMIITFTLTGQKGTNGFCNLTIPKSTVSFGTSPAVYIDDELAQNQGFREDSSNYYVWYTTPFSTHQISISFTVESSPLEPSISLWVALAVFLAILFSISTTVLIALRRTNHKQNHG